MNHRFKVLVVGLALVTAGVAGCSSTTAGSSEAMQDEATAATSEASAGAASSAAISSAAPVASAAVAPATPSPSPTEPEMLGGTSNSPNQYGCEAGLEYACGDPGPGGGIVFFGTSTSFPCGANLASMCNFLEAAPNGWNGKEVKCPDGCDGSHYNGSQGTTSDFGAAGAGAGTGSAYCSGMGENNPIAGADNMAYGAGYQNTTAMVQNCVTNNAGNAARAYTGGGMTDWSLPSFGELAALQAAPNVQTIGGIAGAYYWSSTQSNGDVTGLNNTSANKLQFKTSTWSPGGKGSSQGVRPVRAF